MNVSYLLINFKIEKKTQKRKFAAFVHRYDRSGVAAASRTGPPPGIRPDLYPLLVSPASLRLPHLPRRAGLYGQRTGCIRMALGKTNRGKGAYLAARLPEDGG